MRQEFDLSASMSLSLESSSSSSSSTSTDRATDMSDKAPYSMDGTVDEQPDAKPAEEQPQEASKKVEDDDDAMRVDILEYAHISVSVLIPVSITMLLVVIAVRMLFVKKVDVTSVYSLNMENILDQTGNTTAEKLLISVVSALIFLLMMIGVTLLLVILYKKGHIKIILSWLVASVLMIYGGAGSFFAYQFVLQYNIPFDYISFAVIVANVATVCSFSVFWIGPRWLGQASLILISVITATYLSQLPEWTTWAILIVIACYDLFAVLCPRGPLKMLLETAEERNEPIPALLYNASVTMMMAEPSKPLETQLLPQTASQTSAESGASLSDSAAAADAFADADVYEVTGEAQAQKQAEGGQEDDKPAKKHGKKRAPLHRKKDSEDDEGGVKLGLGDFVFYSVLMGRAAITNMLTVFMSYTAIGLFATLILLGIFRRALPALPISIALGTLFYFLSRVVLMPFVISNTMDEVSI